MALACLSDAGPGLLRSVFLASVSLVPTALLPLFGGGADEGPPGAVFGGLAVFCLAGLVGALSILVFAESVAVHVAVYVVESVAV